MYLFDCSLTTRGGGGVRIAMLEDGVFHKILQDLYSFKKNKNYSLSLTTFGSNQQTDQQRGEKIDLGEEGYA